jgi:hypothetical protein
LTCDAVERVARDLLENLAGQMKLTGMIRLWAANITYIRLLA